MRIWSSEQVENELRKRGWYKDKREVPNCIHFVLKDNTLIDCYKDGRIEVNGKETKLKKEASGLFEKQENKQPSVNQRGASIQSDSRVFIVHGHDTTARDELELILRRLKLHPIILQNLPPSGDTIIEKLEQLTDTDFSCVLLTPDDQGHRHGFSNELRPRARQNVVLELGMMFAKLGRKRVAILVKGSDIENPSDIAGLIYLPFRESIYEIRTALAGCLRDAGFNIDVRDLI